MNEQEALEVEKLFVSYHEREALSNISFKIPKGLLVGVVGPNGAGKSSLLKAICGMIDRRAKSIKFFGRSFAHFRKKIAFVPQRSAVEWKFPITVFEVVLMGAYPRLNFWKRPTEEDRQKAALILKKVGLQGFEQRSISDLSGGQQQRVFVARALMQEAEIFFLDEPFAGIDVASEKAILHILKDLKKEGKTLLVVHHDICAWKRYFDWLVLINKDLIAYGPTEDVLTKEHITCAYGGPLDFFNDTFFQTP